jgi:hypothetical protein
VHNLLNRGDASVFLCDNQWSQRGCSTLGPYAHRQYGGADVRGLSIVKSYGVRLHDVSIDKLTSEEGSVFALDVVGDSNGGSPVRPSVEGDKVIVGGALYGGNGKTVRSFQLDPVGVDFDGLIGHPAPDPVDQFVHPRVSMTLVLNSSASYDGMRGETPGNATQAFYDWTGLGTEKLWVS